MSCTIRIDIIPRIGLGSKRGQPGAWHRSLGSPSRRNTAACDRLVLIITRLDPGEDADPAGSFTITLDSAGCVSGDVAGRPIQENAL